VSAEQGGPTAPSTPPARRAAVAFIFVTVLLDMMALGMVLPVLPKLVESFTGGDTARASEIYGVFGAVFALMQFLFSPLLGALSDRYGRRPLVLISNLGLGLDYLVMALAPNLIWLFVGRVISGITTASIIVAFAYIADVTAPEKRAQAFGLVGAAFGVGFVLGPAVGGVLGGFDPRLPFWAAAAFSLVNACYGLFVLPESLPQRSRARFRARNANPVGALVLLRSHHELIGLAASNFLGYLAHQVLQTVFVLYAGYRYGWDERAVGLSLAVVGVSSLVVQAGLVGWFVRRLGERKTVVVGVLFGATGMAMYGLAMTGWMFLAAIPVMALWGVASAAVQSLMSQRVSESEQGRLQGANTSLNGIASMIGPLIFAGVFAYSIGSGRGWNLPGAAFLLSALMLAAAAAIAWYATRPSATATPAAGTS
jgi:DHA1 family tetracycline resistance protein-like MFS transporter